MLGLSNRLNSSSQGGGGFKDLYSVLFDGVDEHIQVGDHSAFDITGHLTLAAWIKIDSFANLQDGIITKCDSDGIGYGLNTIQSGSLIAFFPRNHNAQKAETGALSTGTWYHIVGTHDTDANENKIYVNRTLVETTADTNAMATNSSDLDIGRIFQDSAYTFDGNIDEVAIWDVALDADAITKMYNGGIPLDLSINQGDYDNAANLKGYWRMGDGGLDSHPLIADQTNPTFGSDIVEANTADLGSFDTDTTGSWSKNATLTHQASTGDAILSNLSGSHSWLIYKASLLTVGGIYKATFKVKATDNTSYLSLTNTSGVKHSYSAISNPALSTTYQNYEFIFAAVHVNFEISTSASSTTYTAANPDTGDTFTFDDIIIKQVNGNPGLMLNMEAADIEEDTP